MNPNEPNDKQPGDGAAEWAPQPPHSGPEDRPPQPPPQSGPQPQFGQTGGEPGGYGTPAGQPGYAGPEGQTSYIPATGYQAGGWTGQTQAVPGMQPPPQQPNQGYPGGPPGYPPQQQQQQVLRVQLPLQVWLIIGSILPGIVTYFMGLVAWVTIDDTVDLKAEEWAEGLGNSIGLPAFLSPILVLNPGYFFILLGVVGVATAFIVLPAYRRFVPLLAIGAVIGWLGLLACALAVPPFIPLGAGAITGLILGAVQMALLIGAAVLHGLGRDR